MAMGARKSRQVGEAMLNNRRSRSFLTQRTCLVNACACMGECTSCKLLLPFIDYLFSSDNLEQAMHQRLPYPHVRAGGAGPAPHHISKLLCSHLSSRGAHHTILIK
eukprot:1140596-Pelagomonas_calceolata.AAC.1